MPKSPIDKSVLRCLLICFTCVTYQSVAETEIETISREYPIPEHGMLVMQVPENWYFTYYEPGDQPSPIIIFYPEETPHNFQLTVSPLWDDGYQRNIIDPDYIKQFVTRVGQDALRYSDQEQLELLKLTGTSGQGFYFQLSDSSAPEHEFGYLTQGALSLNDVLLVFSFFSNQENDIRASQTIEMLENAVQNHQRVVHFKTQ